jgi:hypothetical protein
MSGSLIKGLKRKKLIITPFDVLRLFASFKINHRQKPADGDGLGYSPSWYCTEFNGVMWCRFGFLGYSNEKS